jgi:GrpB-like predicted nucleotidyltransferase (UPF0157 family)
MPVPNHVHLTEYNKDWPCQFRDERELLARIFGAQALAIEHIGSTSVPGLAAKPTVDIAVAVPSLDIVPEVVPSLEQLDYEYLGEYGLPGRHFFRKPVVEEEDKPSFHLHVALKGSNHMTAWLTFRDLLSRDLRVRDEYLDLKRDLAARFHHDRPSYTAAKSEFIEAHVRAVLQAPHHR